MQSLVADADVTGVHTNPSCHAHTERERERERDEIVIGSAVRHCHHVSALISPDDAAATAAAECVHVLWRS